MGVSGKRHAPAALPQEWPGSHFIGGCLGPRAGLDGWGKFSPLPGCDPRTVQPVTDAIPCQHIQHTQNHFNRIPHIFHPLTQGWPTCGPRRKNLRPSVPWILLIIKFLCKWRHYIYVNPSPPQLRYIYTYTHTHTHTHKVRPSGESLRNYVTLLWVAFGQPCSNIKSTQRYCPLDLTTQVSDKRYSFSFSNIRFMPPKSYGNATYRVIYKSLRDFRTRLRNNQDRHGRKEHINR